MEEQNRCELEVELNHINQNERPIGSWLCCLPCYWLERNSGFHKISLSIVTLLVTVLLVASPVIFLISSIPGDKLKNCVHEGGDCAAREYGEVCLTEECSNAGRRILASMSWKTNPCQDFYKFACGSWKKNTEFPEKTQTDFQPDHFINFVTLQQQVDRNIQKLLMVAEDSDPFQKLGTFYKSCRRAEGKAGSFRPMFLLLEELGGYVEPTEKPQEDLTDLLLGLLRLNGAPLFDIYLDSDLDNSSKLAPFIDLPLRVGFNVAFQHWRHSNEISPLATPFETSASLFSHKLAKVFSSGGQSGSGGNEAYNFIKASIEEKRLLVMEKIMRDFMPHNFSSEKKINETQNTLHLANVITKLYPKEKEIIKSYQRETKTKMTVGELERRFPFVRWQYLLNKFLKLNASLQDQVFVLPFDYLETLQRVLHRFPFRVIHNGLLLIFATDTLYELVNTSSPRDWSAFCNKMAVRAFGKAVSVLYVRQYEEAHLEKLNNRVAHVFNTLKKSFEKRIEKMSWLDEETREAVSRKLTALRIQFLNWPGYRNASYVASIMEDVQVHPEDFFGNVIRRYRQLRDAPVNLKRDGSEEKRWTYPFVVNAFYVLTINTIIVPLALLTQPYFGEDVPLYIPYSTLGLIIAHEILHGFDLKGIDYDSEGNVGGLMTRDSKAKFEARLDCFVKQFSSSFWRKVPFLGTNVDIQFDWNVTKNENMADISGLQMAYQAWKGLTGSGNEAHLPGVALDPHQLFFLNAAQTYCAMLSPADYIFLVEIDFHTPQPERVNGIMMNSPGFAEAFKCPSASPMNPKKKCSAW